MEENNKKEETVKEVKKPAFIIKLISLIIIIAGIIGFIFFLAINIIQITNPTLLDDFNQQTIFNNLKIYCSLQIIFHISLIVGGFYLINGIRKGYYVIIITLISIILMDFLMENNLILLNTSVIVIIITILTIYRNRLY